jgi:hypothetical protein
LEVREGLACLIDLPFNQKKVFVKQANVIGAGFDWGIVKRFHQRPGGLAHLAASAIERTQINLPWDPCKAVCELGGAHSQITCRLRAFARGRPHSIRFGADKL